MPVFQSFLTNLSNMRAGVFGLFAAVIAIGGPAGCAASERHPVLYDTEPVYPFTAIGWQDSNHDGLANYYEFVGVGEDTFMAGDKVIFVFNGNNLPPGTPLQWMLYGPRSKTPIVKGETTIQKTHFVEMQTIDVSKDLIAKDGYGRYIMTWYLGSEAEVQREIHVADWKPAGDGAELAAWRLKWGGDWHGGTRRSLDFTDADGETRSGYRAGGGSDTNVSVHVSTGDLPTRPDVSMGEPDTSGEGK